LYSTCLFCHSDLGANEVIEHFPVGRRLAFDGERGRLWVVCRACERWNLTPIEERWEAIEECERLFRGTTLRMSTDHIGLARVREGLELVRVGDPQRPEMAAWRYGDQFGRRRRRYYMVAGGSAVAVGAFFSGFIALGAFAGGGAMMLNIAVSSVGQMRNRRIVARVPTPEGVVDITRGQLPEAKIERSGRSGWQLSLKCTTHPTHPTHTAYRWWEYQPSRFAGRKETLNLEPRDALPALVALLPSVNGRGGTRRNVQTAVELIERAGDVTRLLDTAASIAMKTGWNFTTQGRLSTIPIEARLALEMMTHEDDERRALEGELAALEERWKEAEEIASISDNMFLPPSITEWMRKMRA
jgi:hypothetical protein